MYASCLSAEVAFANANLDTCFSHLLPICCWGVFHISNVNITRARSAVYYSCKLVSYQFNFLVFFTISVSCLQIKTNCSSKNEKKKNKENKTSRKDENNKSVCTVNKANSVEICRIKQHMFNMGQTAYEQVEVALHANVLFRSSDNFSGEIIEKYSGTLVQTLFTILLKLKAYVNFLYIQITIYK